MVERPIVTCPHCKGAGSVIGLHWGHGKWIEHEVCCHVCLGKKKVKMPDIEHIRYLNKIIEELADHGGITACPYELKPDCLRKCKHKPCNSSNCNAARIKIAEKASQ